MARSLEFAEPSSEVFKVDRVRLVELRVAGESVTAEMIRVVFDHPLALVLVEARVTRASAAPGATAVFLAPAMGPAPAQLAGPTDHSGSPPRASGRASR